ncbi:MAG TPA: hypothetical protein VM052_01215 [Candidatus Limnocylindrales bacterium]|nr:hypothetical protein [Candidatus Limnocylindrales bacterium]
MSDDPRLDRVVRRIEGPLDPTATRAAEDRVWRRLQEGHPVRGRSLVPAFAVMAAAVVLLVAGAYLQSYRIEVASGGLPVLYQEHVASTEIGAADRVRAVLSTGTLEIRQGHFSSTTPQQLRVVAIDDVRIGDAALPATVEIRYREQGSAVSGVLARTADLNEARRGTAEVRHSVIAPLPPVARGDIHIFEVWLHIETKNGIVESPKLTVEVRGAAEGERARPTASR